MGHGKEAKTRPDPRVDIQEKGEIFFFYRPKVGKHEARSPDDVQRMYVVLRPEAAADGRAVEEKQAPDSGKEGHKKQQHGDGGEGEGGHGKEEVDMEERPLLRLIVMGKKSLPDPAERRRPYWGYVELVTTDVNHIKDALKEEDSRYAPADPPDLLNYEGCEFLLIAASDDVEGELGLELETETDAGAKLEGAGDAAGCSDLVKMFGEVADVKPLLSGNWD
uniref:Uncharacterized protein n=1 Tax=Oryza brachyantha TaxID=4533 RepID=J3L9I2_ORYBR